ncbi:hypothetical protein BC829DRAFT_119406 [Chytridium lagenaria]|nr:hypothetical protein BC829DRAFT_119406 [Chytridium lagenaria]
MQNPQSHTSNMPPPSYTQFEEGFVVAPTPPHTGLQAPAHQHILVANEHTPFANIVAVPIHSRLRGGMRAQRRGFGFGDVCWNMTRGCGYSFLFVVSAIFFGVLFWFILPWTGELTVMRTPGDRQILKLDTRYLKEAQFSLPSHTELYVIENAT